MPTQKRQPEPGLIRLLLEQPQRFEFVQAVRLLEQWLARRGIGAEVALTDILRFQNSVSLSFPASQIESLALETALEDGELRHVRLTPAFIGFLGANGALPSHYSERIAVHVHFDHDEGPRAFLDTFSSRLVALFYKAWRKYRLELPPVPKDRDALLPLLMSLSGTPAGGAQPAIPEEAAAYYAAAFRQRPASPFVIEQVLADYFDIPVTVETNVGYWRPIEAESQAQLGGVNTCLGVRCMLGPRQWRRDLKVGIKLGPLDKVQYEKFLPASQGAQDLNGMLSMFAVPGLQFEVSLVLRAQDVHGVRLAADREGGGARLGLDTFVLTGGAPADRREVRYLLNPL